MSEKKSLTISEVANKIQFSNLFLTKSGNMSEKAFQMVKTFCGRIKKMSKELKVSANYPIVYTNEKQIAEALKNGKLKLITKQYNFISTQERSLNTWHQKLMQLEELKGEKIEAFTQKDVADFMQLLIVKAFANASTNGEMSFTYTKKVKDAKVLAAAASK